MPAGADPARWLAELDRIKCEDPPATPRQCAEEHERRAQIYRSAQVLAPKSSALAEELTQEIRREDEQAKLFRQIAEQPQPYKFARQYEILLLWENAGGDLKYNTPRKRKDEARWPDREGPVISYYRAAARRVFGETPTAERAKHVVRHYRRFQRGAAVLSGAGTFTIKDELVWLIPPKATLAETAKMLQLATAKLTTFPYKP